jgi:hypothetical protein
MHTVSVLIKEWLGVVCRPEFPDFRIFESVTKKYLRNSEQSSSPLTLMFGRKFPQPSNENWISFMIKSAECKHGS